MTILLGVAIIVIFFRIRRLKSESENHQNTINELGVEIYKLKTLISQLEEKQEKLVTSTSEPVVALVAKEDVVIEIPVTDEVITPIVTTNPITAVAEDDESVKFSDLFENRVQKKSLIRFNSENWVGVNLLNRIGALLIVIGAIATAAFDGIPTPIRTMILFGFAFGVIGLGELMNRKKPTTASMGVTATGVALAYVAIAASHFFLGTLGMYSALIACIFATVLGIYLAIRYDAQVVACFALIGGYLPIFALDPLNDALTTGLTVYFILLSVFSLSVAMTKKWSISNFIGLGLTICGTIYLGLVASPLIAFLYAIFAFLIYTILPILSTYRTEQAFDTSDFVLVIINAFTSSVLVFSIATRLEFNNIHTILSVVFALIYFGLSLLIKRIFQHKDMETIFILKALAFVVLFVPFTFESQWYVIAWLLQALVLTSFGILRKSKLSEIVGLVILALSVVAFWDDVLFNSSNLTLNYSFLSLGVLIILGVYIKTTRQHTGIGQVFKWITLLNLWLFVMYLLQRYVHQTQNGYTFAVNIVASLILVLIYVKWHLIRDAGMVAIATVIHGSAVLALWYSNLNYVGNFYLRSNNLVNNSGVLILNLVLTLLAFGMIICHQQKSENKKLIAIYQGINLVNSWIVIIFVLERLFGQFIGIHLILISVTFVIALLITRLSVFKNEISQYIAVGMKIVGLVWLAVFNLTTYESMFLLLAINAAAQLLALLALNDLLTWLSLKNEVVSPFKLLILLGYFLLVLTQGVMIQGQVAFNSVIISIIFVITSLIWIVLGLYLKNKTLRKFGLYLSMLSVVKLLVVDTWGLSTGMRIVSYFTLGVVLMLISFLYQKFNKESDE